MLFGVDLGGTKIEGTVLGDDGAPLAEPIRIRVPTDAAMGYEHIIGRIVALVRDLSDRAGEKPRRVGFGTPGTVDPVSGLMRGSNTTCLNGQPLRTDLERALGAEVRIANDANLFALAEATLGAAKGCGVVFGVIMGTGVGGGVVVGGRVLTGLQGIAGEWGHNVLDSEGEPCYCGKKGCVETMLSGPATERVYERLTGKRLDLKTIYELHRAKQDPFASLTIAQLCEHFGWAISYVVNILDPDAIVLGGGVGNIEELYTVGAEAAKSRIFNPEPRINLLRPSLGDSAGVFGAALLAGN